MTPVLELKDLHVTLRQHRRATELVKGVSFAVGPGECLGILGESGSGKSMSMKAAMGLLDKGFSVSGTATFQGEALLEKSGEELRRLRGGRVGIVLQNPMTCFDPLYRVGDQIAESFAAHNSWSGEEIRRRSLELLEKNRQQFSLSNMEIVAGTAPEALEGLPAPTHVFIGGSGGSMEQIVDTVLRKNRAARFVANLITPESLAAVMDLPRTLPVTDPEIVMVTAARSKKAGNSHLMLGANPVWIVTFSGREDQ